MPYGHQTWSEEHLGQALDDDDDLDKGQRSTEVKWGQIR